MKNLRRHFVEFLFLLVVMLLSVAGFWNIYFGANAIPTPYQNLHVLTVFLWLFLVAYQLYLVASNNYLLHRKIGVSILILGPFLVASTALLTVHSAHKGVVSGEGDVLVVQNVMVTIELAFVILMAFIVKKNRRLHGNFMLSTALLFMGIALFFTLISFVPQFKIDGPETFYRFAVAATVARYVCFFVGLLLFLKDRKNSWPLLVVGSFFTVNEFINSFLSNNNLIQPLTELVGSFNEFLSFIGTFIVLLVLLLISGVRNKRPELKMS